MKKALSLLALIITLLSCKKENTTNPTTETKKVISIQLISIDNAGVEKIEN